jgi:hypothetical protein
LNERTAAKLCSGIILNAKWGRNLEGIYDLEGKRRERKDGDNPHGAIALPRKHLLKERLIGAQPPSLFASYSLPVRPRTSNLSMP